MADCTWHGKNCALLCKDPMSYWMGIADRWYLRMGQLYLMPLDAADYAQFWPSVIQEIESAGGIQRILATFPAGLPADILADELHEVYQLANTWMNTHLACRPPLAGADGPAGGCATM